MISSATSLSFEALPPQSQAVAQKLQLGEIWAAGRATRRAHQASQAAHKIRGTRVCL